VDTLENLVKAIDAVMPIAQRVMAINSQAPLPTTFRVSHCGPLLPLSLSRLRALRLDDSIVCSAFGVGPCSRLRGRSA
jgi:hypothetical protein